MSIKRNLPNDEYEAAVGANAPSSANVYATIADVGGGGAFLPLAGGTMTGAIEVPLNALTSTTGTLLVTNAGIGHIDALGNLIGINSADGDINYENGTTGFLTNIKMSNITASQSWDMPDATGIVALVTDNPAPSLINTAVATTFVTPNETINCTGNVDFAVTLPNGDLTIDLVQWISRTVQSNNADWIII